MFPTINLRETGINLRRIMDKRGITPKDIKEFLNIGSIQTVYNWFNGQNMPTVDNLYALSQFLQVSIDEIICGNRKAVNNWIISDISRILNEKELDADQIPFTAEHLGHLVQLIDKGTISNSIGKKVLEELFENPKEPSKIIEEKGWVQISDEGAIKEVVLKVLENNPQSVADYKAGKDKALGYLVGQAMKETRGKANPQMLNKMFMEELKK